VGALSNQKAKTADSNDGFYQSIWQNQPVPTQTKVLVTLITPQQRASRGILLINLPAQVSPSNLRTQITWRLAAIKRFVIGKNRW
jgi:hypothetical protein